MQFLSLFLTLFVLACHGFQFQQHKELLPSRRLFSLKSTIGSNSISNSPLNVVRSFVNSNFGLSNPDIIDEDFDFVFRSRSFSKTEYLNAFAKETSALLRASPNFDYRFYNFITDESKPDLNSISFKIRPIGKLTGPFSFKGDVYLPNQKTVELPIQQFSATIANNKIVKLNYGPVVDKLSGNTGGLSGPYGLLYALGEAPSELKYLPIGVAVKKFFSRRRKPIKKTTQQPSPFINSVLFALASQIVDSSLTGGNGDLGRIHRPRWGW
jgi:hypothetical protein